MRLMGFCAAPGGSESTSVRLDGSRAIEKPARRYLTAADAAEYVGHTPNTLANYRSCRIGAPLRRVRGRVLYAVADLDEWVRANSTLIQALTSAAEAARDR